MINPFGKYIQMTKKMIAVLKGRAKIMRTIKVTGKGKIAVKPDMIRLYVSKEELCKEYEDTLRRSTEDESYQDRDKSWKRRFKGYKYSHRMKIEFEADNKRLGQVLYSVAHSSLKPEFSISSLAEIMGRNV